MKIKKLQTDVKREVELPTLIDMVFLLLIFFIATLSFSSGGDPQAPSPEDEKKFELPQAMGKTIKTEGGKLTTLLFQIQYASPDDPASPKVLFVLWPDEKGERTEAEALKAIQNEIAQMPPDTSHYARFPQNFLDMTPNELKRHWAFQLIAESIEKYKGMTGSMAVREIEIRAIKDTEFKIINYILTECSSDDETENEIPKINFRVLVPETKPEEAG